MARREEESGQVVVCRSKRERPSNGGSAASGTVGKALKESERRGRDREAKAKATEIKGARAEAQQVQVVSRHSLLKY
jgi:hypothetical protein